MAKNHRKESFADMFRDLQSNAVKDRPVETIEERKYFLIVCEGIRTEPIYFTHLQKFLPKHLLETIHIIGEGDNTVNVVKRAIEERDKRAADPLKPDFDEVWAVYDKDDFPAERFNQAVKLAGQAGIESGHSNQAFELWYVLHFQYLDTALNRSDYFDRLTKLLGFKYEKNAEEVVTSLFAKGDVRLAIARGKKLTALHHGVTASKAHPSTRVHLLVEKLLLYSKHESMRQEPKGKK